MVAGCIGEVYHIFCILKNPHLCRHVKKRNTSGCSLTYWITVKIADFFTFYTFLSGNPIKADYRFCYVHMAWLHLDYTLRGISFF